jgi:hypothetical protein
MFKIASNTIGKPLGMSAVRNARTVVVPTSVNRTLVALSRTPEIWKNGLPRFKVTSSRRYLPWVGVTTVGIAIGQYYYGNEQNFYDYRFIVDADPDDLADFYGSENFMVCLSITFID